MRTLILLLSRRHHRDETDTREQDVILARAGLLADQMVTSAKELSSLVASIRSRESQ